jgi:putative membrane protein
MSIYIISIVLSMLVFAANGLRTLPKSHMTSRCNLQASVRKEKSPIFDPLDLTSTNNDIPAVSAENHRIAAGALMTVPALATMFVGSPAEAAFQSAGNAIPSAFAAYGHYLGLGLVVGSLVTERLTVKAGMSDKDEEFMGNADIVYGIAGVLVLYTGYLRVTEFGKGWDFYQHSPVFWVKMLLFSIMGSSSLFPTIKIIQRLVARRNGEEVPPMSEKLASRMTTIMNGELLAVGSIPLAATLMARGVGYSDALPWQAGAAPVGLAVVGLGAKYVKEALDWTEDE